MYDPMFTKSFSRAELKRFGCCAVLLGFIVAFCVVSSSLRLHLHPLSLIGDAVKMQLPMNAAKSRIMVGDDIEPIVGNAAKYLQLPSEAAESKLIVAATSTHFNNDIKMKKTHSIICKNSNYCEIEGDVRIEAKTSTIYVATSNSTSSRSIEPYPRKGTCHVKNWTVALVQHDHDHNHNGIPKCTQTHSHPAILFSVGGFTGNFFHDFADVLFPLFSTSFKHQGRVQFLATDHKPWWMTKYSQILNKLTKHSIIDIDRETSDVHCYNRLHIGLKFHKELIIHPSTPSMHDFRVLLRHAFSLRRSTAMRRGDGARPRLMIISRKRTRTMRNEGAVSRLATKMGFEVVVAETGVSMNLSRFAETVNSCDVLMGVHGAGLTNMVFLPDHAVLVQVVPFGGVDGFARLDFGNPAAGMNISYLEYKVGVKESSLRREYSVDHPVLRDPDSYRNWDEIWSIYLNQQNVTLDLHRIKGVFANALKLLL